MLTEREREKLIRNFAAIFVAAGGILTLSYAIYFIVDTLKKWYWLRIHVNFCPVSGWYGIFFHLFL